MCDMGSTPAAPLGFLGLSLYDGARQLMPKDTKALITLKDRFDKTRLRKFLTGSEFRFSIELTGGPADDFRLIVAIDGHEGTGMMPVPIRAGTMRSLALMAIPKNRSFNFAAAKWTLLGPAMQRFLGEDRVSYEDAMEQRPRSLATLLNIVTALNLLPMAGGGTALSFCRELEWPSLKPDRFYAWTDDLIAAELTAGGFAPSPRGSHKGATRTFKQTEFAEANVQLSLHENARHPANVNWMRVEYDMDYYRDKGAHLLLEVARNRLTGSKTDAARVYQLRWMAGRRKAQDFAPPFTVV